MIPRMRSPRDYLTELAAAVAVIATVTSPGVLRDLLVAIAIYTLFSKRGAFARALSFGLTSLSLPS
jgi:hypothetical protein